MAMRAKALPLVLALALCYMMGSWTVTSFTAPSSFVSPTRFSKSAALRAAAIHGARQGCKGSRVCMNALGLFYSTQTGNTEAVAGLISAATGVEAQLIDDVEAADLAGYDGLIVGAPTWNTGADESRTGTAWDDVFDTIRGLDLKGKPVAVFGCGDSAGYGDNFCDGIEEVHGAFAAAGAKMLGQVDASGYSHSESKSQVGDKFLGLPCDQDNEDDQSEGRVNDWSPSSSLKECLCNL